MVRGRALTLSSMAILVAILVGLLSTTGHPELATASVRAEAEPPEHLVKRAPEGIVDHWTKRRMRRAEPLELKRVPQRSAAGADSSGGTTREREPLSHFPYDSHEVADPTTYPSRTHGKVFFDIDDKSYVCSATIVHSEARNVAWTAGHCVFDSGGTEQFVKNLIFVPAYEDGTAPYGVWPAEALTTTAEWEANGNINFDLAAAALDQVDGEEIEDAIGSRGIAFEQVRAQFYDAYGYPAVSPFTGEKSWVCESAYFGDDPFYEEPGPPAMGINCDMTGGSSGGGWVISGGYVASVNSFGYPSEEDHLYGPYQGPVAKSLYSSVDGATGEPNDLIEPDGPAPETDPPPANEDPPPPSNDDPPPPSDDDPPPADDPPPPSNDDPPPADTTAPQTAITSGPAGGAAVSDPTPRFSFASSEPGSSFQCQLDGFGYQGCGSSKTLGPLRDGRHLLTVRSTDTSGNTDRTPASRVFIVDTTVADPLVRARKKQRQKGRRVKVKAKVGAGERITAVGRGKVKIRRPGRRNIRIKLRRVKKTVEANEATVLRLKPKRKRDGRKIRKAINRGMKVRAPINVRVKDQLGNKSPERRVVRLK